MVFSEILVEYRKESNLTQKALSKRLNALDRKNYGVDEITISRWENAVSCPSIKKQCRILCSLELERFIPFLVLDYYRRGRHNLSLGRRYKNNFHVTDIPYMKNEGFNVRVYNEVLDEKVDFYCEYNNKIYNVNASRDSISRMLNIAESKCLVECYSKRDEIVGHMFYIIVDNSFLSELCANPCNCKAMNMSGMSLYIISGYASTEAIFTYFINLILNVLLIHDGPDFVYVKSTFNELNEFFLNLSAKVVSVGVKSENGPKYKGVSYDWVLYEVEKINFISSKESVLFLDANTPMIDVC